VALSFTRKGAYRMAGWAVLLATGLTLAVSAIGSAQQSGPHVFSTPTISGIPRVARR